MWTAIIVAWMITALIPAWVAEQKRRSPIGWLLVSLFASPLVALIALAAVPPADDRSAEESPAQQSGGVFLLIFLALCIGIAAWLGITGR